MTHDFDLETGPLPDLGLKCKTCGYPLAGLHKCQCPECGRLFTLEEYIPPGPTPRLYADGKPVRATQEVVELLGRYDIPWQPLNEPSDGMFGGIPLTKGQTTPAIGVSQSDYFFTVDLIRRQKQGEPLPPEPDDVTRLRPTVTWTCTSCGEENPGHFDICWSCQQPTEDAC